MEPDNAGSTLPLSESGASRDSSDLEGLARRMSDVFENLSDAVIVVDRSGNVILRNRASRELTGLHEFEGGNVLKTTNLVTWNLDGSPVDAADYPARRLFRGLSVRDEEYIAQRRDGSRLRIVVNGYTVQENGRISLAVVTYRDVTERRRVEEMKEDYLRALSHDVRNLLAILMGESQMLLHELSIAGSERSRRYTGEIIGTAKRMKLMMDDLSDSLRMESGHDAIHRTPVDLHDLVRDVVASAEALGMSPMTVESAGSFPPVAVDGPRIERCLVNLLSNAVKYSPPGSPVSVHLACDDAHVDVTVSDKGFGIDPVDLPHIFERFYRGRSVAGREGLGLGLYVCKMTADAHGGSIIVDSVPGQGSKFTLRLPIR